MEDGRSAAAAVAKGKEVENTSSRAADEEEEVKNTSSREEPRRIQMPGITDALRQRLEELGATEPSFMVDKCLVMSDVNREQARLLFSCKRESLSQSPVTAVFTKTERQFIMDTTGTLLTRGLLVTAFDRDGRSYNLTCKYLESNSGYRFITGWKGYVEDNNLGVKMRVELWRFRSRKLPNRYELRPGKDGKKDKVPVMVDSGHPDGSMGLVLLHYGNNDDLLEPELVGADEAMPIQETENGLEPEQGSADEHDEAPPVQETGHMESKTTTTAKDKLVDDGRTCAHEPIKSKTRITEDKKIADDGGECAGRMIRTEISREDVISAAKGLLKLREYYGRGGGRGRGRRGGEPES